MKKIFFSKEIYNILFSYTLRRRQTHISEKQEYIFSPPSIISSFECSIGIYFFSLHRAQTVGSIKLKHRVRERKSKRRELHMWYPFACRAKGLHILQAVHSSESRESRTESGEREVLVGTFKFRYTHRENEKRERDIREAPIYYRRW